MEKNSWRILLFLSFHSLIISLNGQTWQWAKSGWGNIGFDDEGISVCNDTLGNSFITGFFQGPTIGFGSYTLTNPGSSMINGTYNSYLVKYDQNGNVLWAKSPKGASAIGYDVTADNNGNIYQIGGYGGSSVVFDTYTLTNSTNGGIFIVKYDPSGNAIWARSPVGNYTVGVANSICIDVNGDILITGLFGPSIVFGAYTLTSTSSNGNMFLVKYDSNGNVIWARSEGGTGRDVGNDVSTDAIGNIYLTGYFSSPILSIGTATLNNSGNTNTFIIKFDSNGNPVWAKCAGGSQSDIANSIITDKLGNSYITGSFQSPTINFGSISLQNLDYSNIFITKYDVNGNVVWAKTGTGNGWRSGNSITLFNGGVIVAGGFNDYTITFDSFTITPGPGSFDTMFLIGLDFSGNVFYADYLTSGGDDWSGISSDKNGNIYVTADFWESPFTIGNNTLTLPGSQAHVTENVFIAKLSTILTVSLNVSNDTICLGDCANITIIPNGSHPPYSVSVLPIAQINNNILTVCPSSNTNYTIVVQDNNSKTFTSILPIYINPKPLVSFTMNLTSGVSPLNVFFTNTSSSTNNYYWSFGDGSSSTNVNSAHTYTTTGSYYATLVGLNSFGCKDSATHIIQVLSLDLDSVCQLRIPNVFTPNSDDINDTWGLKIDAACLRNFSLLIYDRWGLNVFSSNPDISQSSIRWDGRTISGEKCSQGVYYYIIKYKDIRGEQQNLTGYINLLR